MLPDDPAGPRITYYDDATGERIELSTATLANWAAKTANLLRDELGAGPASRVAVLLPAHWQTVAVLFGVWWIGAEVSSPATPTSRCARPTDSTRPTRPSASVRSRCCRWTRSESRCPIFRSASPTTRQTLRVHGDQISPNAVPGPRWMAGRSPTCSTQALAPQDGQGLARNDRVLSTRPWDTADELITSLLAVYTAGASLVQVANPDAALLERRRDGEGDPRLKWREQTQQSRHADDLDQFAFPYWRCGPCSRNLLSSARDITTR